MHTTPRRGPGAATVAVQLWVFAGTADEGPREHGIAHLLEHMVFKPLVLDGVRLDIASAVEAAGGDVNAFTSHDETVFHATVPAPGFEAVLDALVRPLSHARPAAADLAQEAEVVLEEIKQYDDDPASRAMQDMTAGLYGAHGYARPVLGTAPEVAAHTTARLRGFLERNYGGERLALVVAGPLPAARVLRAATRVLGEFEARPPVRALRRPRAKTEPTVVVRRDDVHEAHVALGWQAPPWPDPDACALELAATVLGYGESSWLSRELRRRQGLVTDAHASLFAGRQASTMAVSGHAPTAKLEAAIGAMLEQLRRMAAVPLPADELDRARAVLRSDVVYRRETAGGIAHAIGYYLSLGGELTLDRRYLAQLAAITPQQVRDACARLLAPGRAAVAVVLPAAEIDAAGARALGRRLTARLRGAGRDRRRPTLQRDRDGIVRAELDCGLRVRIAPDPSLAMAAGWLVWPGGQRIEAARHAGISPVMAALLTRGTVDRDGDALAREIEGCAAALDGISGRNSVGLHFECLAGDRELVLRRMIECALRPRFADDEVAHERRLALEELAADRDDLAGLAFEAAAARLYGAHAYGRKRRGTAQTLAAIDAGALRRAWQRSYPIGRGCLALSGDVDPQGVIELLAELLADAEPARALGRWPGPAPRRSPEAVARVRRRREQAHVVLAWPGLTLADPRVWTMEVLTMILGGQVGRLFTALREEQGLVYHVSASSTEGLDAGHVAFYAATSPDKLVRAREALERERARICREPIAALELERAQAYLVGQAEAALQRRGRIASSMAFNEIYGLGYAAHLAYARRIEAVRATDVTALARALLQPSRQITAIVA
ncbi:MAG: insulinase family protein [Nannocystaceae bacterium]|nr:insulinase family protein [Nannocystaceae bacterium]